ncbi:subunit of DNA polymerase II [Cordyceps fumosorosea ARSEF 2679]|uniref:Subunit of DNA polymerase II n=1 Tax=Cordyceps fumosorosea (strain ARSEF 2679) TaxID=1081104 RepID=A0A167EA56_CORFA|nr:subunit of DNA polymerase II [Cordyceps fumosorosea ARSEF 2679]OAA43569.1 subunit of DNA polymerase II [Cordyceps fumosorosea ARSEF 2679]
MFRETSADDGYSIDPTQPLRGIVVCCTSIPVEQRSEIHQKVAELGGVHKYDLTPDITHLIVGHYDTPKYRHVARQRPNIKPMHAAWIDRISHLWKLDEEINLQALEDEYKLRPLERCSHQPQGELTPEQTSLLICLTGFGDPQREQISKRIRANGAQYTGDLTRKCTHLIVGTPNGKKFKAAKAWGVRTVTLPWLDQSIERGMILDESKFDPLLPDEEQGKDAWVKKSAAAFGKRSRSSGSTTTGEDGVRKLRKTASQKLNSQRNNLWENILGRSDSKEYSFNEGPIEARPSVPEKATPVQPDDVQPDGVFTNCVFFIHGFSFQQADLLHQTLQSLGGTIVPTIEEAAVSGTVDNPSWRFLVVPQNSQPDTHPTIQHNDLHVITEFFVERCLHNKQFLHPQDHVLGRPFPSFPIPGFSSLSICSSAFTGLELNQVARSIKQLGATFEEQFQKNTSLLVCRSLDAMRKDKLRYALEWGVPIVSAEWLWDCINTGFNVPPTDYIFPQLKSRYSTTSWWNASSSKEPKLRAHPDTIRAPGAAGMDPTAFKEENPKKGTSKTRSTRYEESTTADFVSAVSCPETGRRHGTPLSELSSASVNKSPSPTETAAEQLPRHRSDPVGKVENKKQVTTRAPSAPPITQHSKSYDGGKSREELNKSQGTALPNTTEKQRLASEITNLLDGPTTAGLAVGTAGPAPGRRNKRQILGRAISNASNASSGSGPAPELLRSASAVETEEGLDEERQPPATQLEYGDPDAQKRKAQLMSRMMGQPVGEQQPAAATQGRTLRKRTY